jgi:predicted nucleic acid-binding protein
MWPSLCPWKNTCESAALKDANSMKACRGLRDDKFLEVALNGRADVIITGDADLLGMHPWSGIAIMSSSDYLRDRR